MSKIKLSYLDIKGGRGEDSRIALHMSGVDFEDDRISFAEWPKRKPSTLFGTVPVLHVEGKGELGQSNAILTYIGREYGMHPADNWEAAKHEALMAMAEELRHKFKPTLYIDDENFKKEKREEIASGYMQDWAKHVEKEIQGPFVSGDKLHVVDLKLFILFGWFIKGGLDYVSPDVFANYQKIVVLYEAVGSHEGVVSWYAKG